MGQKNSNDNTEFEKHEFLHEDYRLPYRLLKPDSVKEGSLYPLIFFFHGSGERGNDNTASLKHIAGWVLDSLNRKVHPAFVVVPQCPENENWTYPDWFSEPRNPMKSVIQLIQIFSRDPNVDTTRIYLTGLSMGGYATWYLLTRFPKKFAAAVPICGGGDWTRASTFAEVPIWAFHGKKDDTVPVEQTRNMVKAIRAAGGKPKYTEYRRVKHNSWDYAYEEEELMNWLFNQVRTTN